MKLKQPIFSTPAKNRSPPVVTSFTAVMLKKMFAQFVYIGDSRLYLLRENGLRQLTEDTTEVNVLVNRIEKKMLIDNATFILVEIKTVL